MELDGERCTMYPLGFWPDPSALAKKNNTDKGMSRPDGRWQGASALDDVALGDRGGWYIHGTNVPCAVQAIHDGYLKPSTRPEGICGVNGVYFLKGSPIAGSRFDAGDIEAITAAWKRSHNGGYQKQAMYIARLYGCLLPGKQGDVLTEGIIRTKIGSGGSDKMKRQLCAHNSCIEYVAVIFNDDMIDAELATAMETTTGYNCEQYGGDVNQQTHNNIPNVQIVGFMKTTIINIHMYQCDSDILSSNMYLCILKSNMCGLSWCICISIVDTVHVVGNCIIYYMMVCVLATIYVV